MGKTRTVQKFLRELDQALMTLLAERDCQRRRSYAASRLSVQYFWRRVLKRGAGPPAQTVLLATNHEPVEVERRINRKRSGAVRAFVQRGDTAVAAHAQTPPNRRASLEEQDVELLNFDYRPVNRGIVRVVVFVGSAPFSLVMLRLSSPKTPTMMSAKSFGTCTKPSRPR
jgi:hypothetical protein